jgi:hypothetical protein
MTRGGQRSGAGRKTLVEGEDTKSFSIKVAVSEAAMIREGAERLDVSQSRLVVEAVREYLAARPGPAEQA